MKKLPIYCSIDFLLKFYAEFDELKKSDKQADEDLFVLAVNFSNMLAKAELYFSKSDSRIKYILQKEDSPRLKNILKNAKNPKDYESSLSNTDNLKVTIQEEPHAIFLIDETLESSLGTWIDLQKNFGIICFKHENWKEKSKFLLNWALFSVGKNSTGAKLSSWDMLKNFRHPCNSMIIAENYILSKTEEIKDNLIEIFDVLLPQEKLTIPFQITILVLESELGGRKIDSRFDILMKELQKIRPDFTFEIQIILVSKNDNHDRNIFTNYFWLHSGHSFSYFENKNNSIRTIKSTNLMLFPISFQQKDYQTYFSNEKISSNSVFEAVQVLLEQAKRVPKTRGYKETSNAQNRLFS